jgi:DNA-binding MarR family transcriptional regulator
MPSALVATVQFHLPRPCSAQVAGPGEGSQCNCTALRKASRRISQLYDTALAPSGLKTTQRAILAQIGRSEPTTVGELAEALVMDSGALAHTLRPLERDGLIGVAVNPDDRRNRLITLTRRGRAKLAETDVLWTKAQRGFEASPELSPRRFVRRWVS